MKLVIGNKNYSSWSLRAWLMLAANKISFEEIRVPLSTPDSHTELKKYSDAAKVPVLLDKGSVIWDSLAICEYVSEQYLDGKAWPFDPMDRALARSCCAEMHSSFFLVRGEMPMNCRAVNRRIDINEELQKEISRIDTIWKDLLTRYSSVGPYLFGEFSIADCMFAPLVFRFNTYDIAISDVSRNYMQTMLDHSDMQRWLEDGRQEKEKIEIEETGM
jgi:glutathione S-transferase